MISSKSLRRGIAAAACAAFLCGAPLALSMVSTPSASSDNETIKAAMNTLKKNSRDLKSMVESKDKYAEALPLVAEMQQALISAKGETPEVVAAIEDAKKKQKELLEFRKTMLRMLEEALKLEEALLDERTEDAKKHFNELGKKQKAGHDRFKGD